MNKHFKTLLRLVSYVLVAAVASCITLLLFGHKSSKLDALQELIEDKFIGQADSTAIEDAAAYAMVDALGDRWSYYIPASQYEAHDAQMKNAYVGIGITISAREDSTGFDILKVEPDSGAQEAGIFPGDILIEVEGQSAVQLGSDGAGELIRGEVGTTVQVAVLREGQRLEFEPERRKIQVQVARGQMLEGSIGYVQIQNFNDHCAEHTIAAVRELVEQGAQALIFDVRNNPGGYRTELVELLDYLLPEGPLFRSVDYAGREEVDKSDADCLELPMAVLVNGESYSAAEFFAAALNEYDWAVIAGEPTTGKGYFQSTYRLGDGSAVGLSVGKYTTPNGVSLAEAGGLTPEIPVQVDEKTAALIYADALDPGEDPQIQAAVDALKTQKNLDD